MGTESLALLPHGRQPRLVCAQLRLEAGVLLDLVDQVGQVHVRLVEGNLIMAMVIYFIAIRLCIEKRAKK